MGMLFKGKYSADGGALRIYTPDMSVDFLNGMGDGTFTVEVTDARDPDAKWKFTNSLVVKTSATISDYDGEENALYSLPKGRYGVYHNNGDIKLVQWDKE